MSFPQPIAKAIENIGPKVMNRFVLDKIPPLTGARVTIADTVQLLSQQIVGAGDVILQGLNHSHIPFGQTYSPNQNYQGTGTIPSGGKLSFDIKSTRIVPEEMYLELEGTNTSSSNAATLLPFIAWFSKIAVSFNNARGSSIDNVGLYEYIDKCMKSSDRELAVLAAKENIDASTYNGIQVAAGASFSFRTKVPGIWNYVDFPMSCVDYTNIDFTFNPVILAAGSGSTSDISITSARLVITPRVLTRLEYDTTENAFKSGVLVKYFELQSEDKILTLAANSSYHVNLSSIQGLTPQLNVGVRAAAPSGATATTFYDYISTIQMYDEAGQNSLGPNEMPANYLNTHQVLDHGIESDFQVSAGHVFYPILFGDGGIYAVEKNNGKFTGYQSLLRNQFDIKTNGSVSSGSYTVTFWCHRLMSVTFKPAPNGGYCQVEFNRI